MRCYRLHICSLVFQVVAFVFSLAVGIYLVVKSNFLSSTKDVISAIRDNDNFKEGSMLKERVDDEDELQTLNLVMKIIGIAAMAVAVIVFINLLCLLSLMCGPNSSFVRYCLCMEELRDHLEDEMVDLKDEEAREFISMAGHSEEYRRQMEAKIQKSKHHKAHKHKKKHHHRHHDDHI